MKKNRFFMAVIPAVFLVFALVLTGCDTGTNGGGGNGGNGGNNNGGNNNGNNNGGGNATAGTVIIKNDSTVTVWWFEVKDGTTSTFAVSDNFQSLSGLKPGMSKQYTISPGSYIAGVTNTDESLIQCTFSISGGETITLKYDGGLHR